MSKDVKAQKIFPAKCVSRPAAYDNIPQVRRSSSLPGFICSMQWQHTFLNNITLQQVSHQIAEDLILFLKSEGVQLGEKESLLRSKVAGKAPQRVRTSGKRQGWSQGHPLPAPVSSIAVNVNAVTMFFCP